MGNIEIAAVKTIMCESLSTMEGLITTRRTVVGRERLASMLRFPLATMQISITGPAIALLILRAIKLGRSHLAIFTYHVLCGPLFEFSVDVLDIILPLVLLCVSNEIFIRK